MTTTTRLSSPQVRTILDWDPSTSARAESASEDGDLRAAAQLADRLMADDRASGVLSARSSLVRLPLTFQAEGSAARVVRALEGGDFWRMCPSAELGHMLAWSAMLGVALARLHWADEEGAPYIVDGRNVPRLEVWHPEHLRFERFPRHRWVTRVGDVGQEVEVTPGRDGWVLVALRGASRPWAHGAWRACRLWWLLKQYAIDDWGRYSEKHGLGVLTGKAPEGATDAQRKELARQLKVLGRDKAIALPSGWDLELVEATAKTYETFVSQIELADSGVAIAIAGQNLSSEVKGGSYAAASVHAAIAHQILAADAEALSEQIHDQILAPYVAANFGAAPVPYPVWDTTPPEDAQQRVQTMKVLGEAIAALDAVGIVTDRAALAEAFRVPVLRVEEPAEPEPEPDDDAEPDDEPEDEPGPVDEGADRMVRLRSGLAVRAAGGFVQGQMHSDRVADGLVDLAARDLRPLVAGILGVVDKASSYEEIRAGLLEQFEDSDPDEFAQLLELGLVLAQLGGHLAVHED